jgi:hypothetical protein
MTESGGPDDPGGYVPPPPYARPDQSAQIPPPYAYPPPPGYGYAAYAYPPPGYGYGYPPAPRQRPRLAFGMVGTGIAGVGFLLVAVSLLALPWFGVDGGLTASDVRALLAERGDIANEFSVSYFSWFSWVLLLVSTACAVTASLPWYGLSLAFRIAGPIVAGFAVLFTLGSIELTNYAYADNTYYFEHLSAGFWVALIGFVIIGAGCIIGPRRHHSPNAGTAGPLGGTFQP